MSSIFCIEVNELGTHLIKNQFEKAHKDKAVEKARTMKKSTIRNVHDL